MDDPKTISESLTNLRKLVQSGLPLGAQTFTRAFLSRVLGGDHFEFDIKPGEDSVTISGFSAFQRAIPTDGPALRDACITLWRKATRHNSYQIAGSCDLTAQGNSISLVALKQVVGQDLVPKFLPPSAHGTPFTEPITKAGGNSMYGWPPKGRSGQIAIDALVGGDATLRTLVMQVDGVPE